MATDDPDGRDGLTGASDPEDPLANTIVSEAVDRAIEPYRGMVSAEDLQAMRVALGDMLVMHPVTARLVSRLRPRNPVRSGEEPVHPEAAGGAEDSAAGRKVG